MKAVLITILLLLSQNYLHAQSAKDTAQNSDEVINFTEAENEREDEEKLGDTITAKERKEISKNSFRGTVEVKYEIGRPVPPSYGKKGNSTGNMDLIWSDFIKRFKQAIRMRDINKLEIMSRPIISTSSGLDEAAQLYFNRMNKPTLNNETGKISSSGWLLLEGALNGQIKNGGLNDGSNGRITVATNFTELEFKFTDGKWIFVGERTD